MHEIAESGSDRHDSGSGKILHSCVDKGLLATVKIMLRRLHFNCSSYDFIEEPCGKPRPKLIGFQ
jgi:hypothetical protein